MTPTELLQAYATTPAILVGVSLLVLLALVATMVGRRRTSQRGTRAPSGAGVALAHALEGHHERAAEVLETLVRAGGPGRADAVVGLVAVLRAQGSYERATNLVEALAERGGAEWIDAVRVRLALDRGRVERAAELADRPGVPVDLALAAYARSGRFDEAVALYHRRVKRKARDAEVEATLVAGQAAAAARRSELRAARKLAKRAVALSGDTLAAAAVGNRLHPKDGERARLRGLLAERTRWAKPHADSGIGSEVSVAAAASPEAREQALAALREHLDVHPGDHEARRLYGEWVLREGGPGDWRSELAEVLENLPEGAEEEEGVAHCGRCGYRAEAVFFVCPRCDAFGSLEMRGKGRLAAGGVQLAETGAALAALMVDAGIDVDEPPG